ncbi:MAG: family 43 glycosylhydrolase [Acidimicrobiales bacterium]
MLTIDPPEHDQTDPAPAGEAEGPSPAPATRRRLRAAVVVGLVAVVAAAAGVGVGRALPDRAATARGTRASAPPAAPSYDPGTIVDPSLTDLSDPFVLQGHGVDYLYSSSAGYSPPNIPVRAFAELGHLGPPVDAMPTLPPWTTGWTWAPDVRRVGGHYVMWFTAPDTRDVLPTGAPAKCIGVAVADGPTGPFLPGAQPVLCGPWGSIDPRTFVDAHGQLWLYWKSDDNADTRATIPTTIWAQRLATNGITLVGPRYAVLSATEQWENGLIEAPDMVRVGSRYYLFFSANPSFKADNGIGVATCRGPVGPCQVVGDGPLFGTSVLGQGPGEESVWNDHGTEWLLFSPSGTGFVRRLAVARLGFDRHGPYLATFGGRSPGVTSPPRR